jgi:hypothetical protein
LRTNPAARVLSQRSALESAIASGEGAMTAADILSLGTAAAAASATTGVPVSGRSLPPVEEVASPHERGGGGGGGGGSLDGEDGDGDDAAVVDGDGAGGLGDFDGGADARAAMVAVNAAAQARLNALERRYRALRQAIQREPLPFASDVFTIAPHKGTVSARVYLWEGMPEGSAAARTTTSPPPPTTTTTTMAGVVAFQP